MLTLQWSLADTSAGSHPLSMQLVSSASLWQEQQFRGVQLSAVTDYHSVFYHNDEYLLQESIGLIQTVTGTLIRLVEIYSDSRVYGLIYFNQS